MCVCVHINQSINSYIYLTDAHKCVCVCVCGR